MLYADRKKPGACTNVWRGEIVRVLYCKAGGATEEAHNVMLLRQMEEDWTPIELKNWYYKTFIGCLKDRVGGKQVQLGTFAPTRDKILWQGKKTVIHWGLFTVGGKI